MASTSSRKLTKGRHVSVEQMILYGVLLTLLILVYNGGMPSIISTRLSSSSSASSSSVSATTRKLHTERGQADGSALVVEDDEEQQQQQVVHELTQRSQSKGSHKLSTTILEQSVFLEPRVKDWDDQREAYKTAHPGCNVTSAGKPTVMLVSGSNSRPCGNGEEGNFGDFLLLKFLKNKQDYVRLHDLPFYYGMGPVDPRFPGFWVKLPMLRMLMLAHREVEWFMWVDSDAMITDMAFEYPIEQHSDKTLVMSGNVEEVYEKREWVALNTGIFFIRNSQDGLDLIDDWLSFGSSPDVAAMWGERASRVLKNRKNWPADDQTALVLMLVGEGEGESEHQQQQQQHPTPLRDRWAPKVHLEQGHTLHGYWVMFVDRLEQIQSSHHNNKGDWDWPFTVHFVGCKLCDRKYTDYDPAACDRGIHRAFNFAENQVLGAYGLTHGNLNETTITALSVADK